MENRQRDLCVSSPERGKSGRRRNGDGVHTGVPPQVLVPLIPSTIQRVDVLPIFKGRKQLRGELALRGHADRQAGRASFNRRPV